MSALDFAHVAADIALTRCVLENGALEAVIATLVDYVLVLNLRLAGFLTDACPAWSKVFDMFAGRLVITDAALMTGDTIERHETVFVRAAVAA